MTLTTSLATPAGTYSITVTAASGSLTHTMIVTLVVSFPPGATFLATDTATQGTWKGVYGADGYAIASHASSYPAYAQVSVSGQTEYTWAGSTSDVRALQKPSSGDRIASTWVSPTSFTIDINMVDGNSHRVALYCLDWDKRGRAQTVEVVNALTGAVLDSKSLSKFSDGKYLVWNLTGNIRIRITKTGGVNAVVSGIFLN
jgi:hypothetical protein